MWHQRHLSNTQPVLSQLKKQQSSYIESGALLRHPQRQYCYTSTTKKIADIVKLNSGYSPEPQQPIKRLISLPTPDDIIPQQQQ